MFGVAKQFEVEESSILDQLEFDAVYLKDENVVQISFEDKSNNTKSVILEVLGMDVTYHQVYLFDGESEFVENIHLEQIPKYGWKTTPITLEIQHSEFGKIGLKTEIYQMDESKPRIIYSKI